MSERLQAKSQVVTLDIGYTVSSPATTCCSIGLMQLCHRLMAAATLCHPRECTRRPFLVIPPDVATASLACPAKPLKAEGCM